MTTSSRIAIPVLLAAVALSAALSWSCGSPTPTPVTPTSVKVTAAMGGVVAAPGGKGTLTIGANALSADTTITLSLTAAGSDTVSDVFDFGPSGTTFSTPASLEIPVDASKLVTGKTFSLAVQNGTTWTAIAGSTYANGKVTGPVAHFSKFSIILVDGNVVVMSDCAAEVAAFMPCGGDIIGTWSFANYCFQSKVLGQDPFQGRCPGFMGSYSIDIAGDITITATTTETSATTSTVTNDWTIPDTCFGADAGFFLSCAQIEAAQKKPDGGSGGTCTDANGACKCTTTQVQMNPAQPAKPRNLDGGDGMNYCVKNGKLYTSSLQPDGGGALIILQKK